MPAACLTDQIRWARAPARSSTPCISLSLPGDRIRTRANACACAVPPLLLCVPCQPFPGPTRLLVHACMHGLSLSWGHGLMVMVWSTWREREICVRFGIEGRACERASKASHILSVACLVQKPLGLQPALALLARSCLSDSDKR